MGRFVPVLIAALSAFFLGAVLSGCGSGSGVSVATYPTPANVALTPSTTASMDVGATLSFTAQPEDNTNTPITQPVSYFSSNSAVVTIAATGVACAGTWDSISNPQVCTPGPTGVAQVTGSAQGVSSPPTTVYVHQHIDSISISPVLTQSNSGEPCATKGQIVEYEAKAFSRGSDITSTVGRFGWSTTNATVVILDTTAAGLSQNQVQATAGAPGVSTTFATLGTVIGVPFNFVTCPVQSITLSVNGSSVNPLILTQGASETISATVKDSLGNLITGVPLTWTSSEPTSVSVAAGSVSQSTPSGTVSATTLGGASVIASCTPPSCNIGFQPSLPIYPESAVGIVVNPTSASTTTAATLYVTSTGCQTTSGCTSTLVPVTIPASTAGTAITVGGAVALPSTANSLVFSRDGTNVYLGTDLGDLGTKGLMKYAVSSTTPTVTQNASVVGKILSISPDGSKAVVSDIADPNSAPQAFIFDTAANTATAIQLASGTTNVAADFSPDSLKAFIVGSSGAASTLYVYSKVDALQTISLSAGTNDVAFLPSGNFGYIAQGTPSQLSLVPTCDNPPPSTPALVETTATTATPSIIRPLVDGRMLAVEPPGIQIFTPAIGGTGCAFPRLYPGTPNLITGDLTVSNTSSFFNLGQGNFIFRQLIVSHDGSTAYILASDANNNPLGVVLVFNIANRTSSAISLTGNAIPLRAELTPDGTVLYVGASDGTVHAVSTVAGGDFQQIAFPLGLCRNASGAPFATTCNPDLLALQP